jgi:hypothetical protein
LSSLLPPDAGDMGQSIGACNHIGVTPLSVTLFRHRHVGRNRAATLAAMLEHWEQRPGVSDAASSVLFLKVKTICAAHCSFTFAALITLFQRSLSARM